MSKYQRPVQHFVRDLGPRGAGTVGQPERGHFPFQRARVHDAGDLVLDQRLGIMEPLREALELIEHRAAFGLGRMRGENQLDGELVEEHLHGLGRNVAGS